MYIKVNDSNGDELTRVTVMNDNPEAARNLLLNYSRMADVTFLVGNRQIGGKVAWLEIGGDEILAHIKTVRKPAETRVRIGVPAQMKSSWGHRVGARS